MNKEEKNSNKCPICGRPTHKESKYCIFHASAEEKTEEEFKKALKKYVDKIKKEDSDYDFKKFIFVGNIDFKEDLNIDVFKNANFREANFKYEVSFNEVTFLDRTAFNKATFEHYAHFSKAIFGYIADFSEATFASCTEFNKAIFAIHANFREAIFKYEVSFNEVNFNGSTEFNKATFEHYAHFSKATFKFKAYFNEVAFKYPTNFIEATFESDSFFNEATFAGDVNFIEATFKGDIYFNKATFAGDVNFIEATFKGKGFAWFEEVNFKVSPDFRETIFQERVIFKSTTFEEGAFFNKTIFGEDAYFKKNAFIGELNFENIKISPGKTLHIEEINCKDKISFQRAYLENTTLDIELAEGIFIDFTDALLRDTNMQRKQIENHILQEGKREYLRAKEIFLKLKNNFHSIGRYGDESWAFKKEKDMERKSNCHLKTLHKWLWSCFLNGIYGYGEKPERVFLSSILIILIFACVFMNCGITSETFDNLTKYNILKELSIGILHGDLLNKYKAIPREQITKSLYFSTVTFTTLGLGDFRPVENTGRIFVGLEAFTGAFMMALFVYTFARRTGGR